MEGQLESSGMPHMYMAVSTNGRGVRFKGVVTIGALLFGNYIRARDVWKLPYVHGPLEVCDHRQANIIQPPRMDEIGCIDECDAVMTLSICKLPRRSPKT